jgi:NitT/TauT family transport system permease protein
MSLAGGAGRERRERMSIGDAIGSVVLFVGLLGGWVLLSANVSPLVFPHPWRVAEDLVRYAASGELWKHFWVTFVEVILGFILGGVLGFGCGALLAHSRRARNILTPYLVTTQAVPKFALAPIFVLWFGFGILPKVIITALIAFFPLLENTVTGLQACEPDSLKLFRSLRASRWQVFVKLRFWVALPYVFAGLRVAMVFSIVGAIVAEYVGANNGLGALIIVAQGTMNTSLMFGVFIVTTLLGLLLYRLVALTEALVFNRRWRRG